MRRRYSMTEMQSISWEDIADRDALERRLKDILTSEEDAGNNVVYSMHALTDGAWLCEVDLEGRRGLIAGTWLHVTVVAAVDINKNAIFVLMHWSSSADGPYTDIAHLPLDVVPEEEMDGHKDMARRCALWGALYCLGALEE